MKRLQVMGPFNSDTNLLIGILMDNCENIVSGSLVKTSENLCFWKHTLRRDFIDGQIHDPNNIFIILFKHLYNWIPSSKRIRTTLSCWIMMSWGLCRCRIIVQLYNRYYRLYRDLLEEHPHNVVCIAYHDLIQKENCHKVSPTKIITMRSPDS